MFVSPSVLFVKCANRNLKSEYTLMLLLPAICEFDKERPLQLCSIVNFSIAARSGVSLLLHCSGNGSMYQKKLQVVMKGQ